MSSAIIGLRRKLSIKALLIGPRRDLIVSGMSGKFD